uniref:Glutamate receptor 3 n=1 Tax=Cacopsylla melanoneura TaxID=428564 RepID=A0A8D8M666_9HEMI
MFWYMFGTFTNLFTFRNTNSWTSSKKGSTRAFVGTYWVFSIIITAAYTGSIIAFITLPVFPETIDTLQQLKSERYRIITLDNSGWQKFNDTQKKTLEHSVFNNWELVPKVEDGLRNVTKGHLLWSYAFLGSKAQLEHIVKNNFENSGSRKKKRSKKMFHIGKQCYLPQYLSFVYPKSSLLNSQLDMFILKTQQSGLINKWMRDVQWDNWRNAEGGRLKAGTSDLKLTVPEDRMLTLDDTLGMFLFLLFGFTLAIIAFINECLTHYNKQIFCCKKHTEDTSQPLPPTITLTPADNVTPNTSVEDLREDQASVYDTEERYASMYDDTEDRDVITPMNDFTEHREGKPSVCDVTQHREILQVKPIDYDLENKEHRELIVNSISPHRRYSMNHVDDKTLVEWVKRRFSH